MPQRNDGTGQRDPINAYVGTRIRVRRKMLGISQERLAAAIGVSFQQVQKYEKGTSGIGAGQLHRIACAMQVPASFFFPETGNDPTGPGGEAHRLAVEFLSNSESVELNLAAAQIRDAAVRRRVVALVRSIAGGFEQAQSLSTNRAKGPRADWQGGSV